MTPASVDSLSKGATHVAEAISVGGREGTLRSAARQDYSTFLDPGEKPNPELLFAGAYAACFHSAMISVTKALGLPLTDAVVHARVGQERDEAGDSHLVVELRAKVPGVPDDRTREWMETAHKICPFSRALRGDAVVTLVVDGTCET